MVLVPVGQAAQRAGQQSRDFVPPVVFQAAGPTANSIQSTVDAFRAALGNPNNGNNTTARSTEAVTARSTGTAGTPTLDYDSPGNAVQHVPEHPRRAVHHTGDRPFPGATSGGPQGGLAVLFNNPTYGTIFSTFSPSRLFTPVGSNITEALFFVPGTNGAIPATVTWLRRGFHRR